MIDETTKKMIKDLQRPVMPEVRVPDWDLRNYAHADYQHEIIMSSIAEFESRLDDNHEVALKLASFGQTILLNVTGISYSNPVLIHFYGYVNGQYATIIQHVNQLNFLIMAVPKQNEQAEPRRIGFIQEDETASTSHSDNELHT